jgi:predicted enzyme related to lactoylglutathione lyase
VSETTVQSRVGEVAWHDLATTDVEAAKRFYAELLGWEYNTWRSGENEYPMIHVGDADHGGVIRLAEGHPAGPHWVAYIRVDDVDATVARAEAEGGSVVAGATDIPEVGRIAVIMDPQGAVIAPFAPSSDSPAPQGTFVWEELHATEAEGAKRFYEAVFGWSSRPMDMGGGVTYTILSRADGEDVAGLWPKPEGEAGPSAWLTYLATDDVDAASAKARSLGATQFLEPTSAEGVGRFAILADPTGAMFGLFQRV